MRKTIIKTICFVLLIATTLSLSSCFWQIENYENAIQYDENGIGFIKKGRYDENGRFVDDDIIAIVRLPVDISGDSCEIFLPEKYTQIDTSPYYICEWYVIGDGYIKNYNGGNAENIPVFMVNIHIGKNFDWIELPQNCFLYKKQDDGKYKTYIISPYFNCSEENEVFYSEDGILYYKSNKKAVFDQ